MNRALRKVMIKSDGQKIQDWCEGNHAFHRYFRERCGNAKLDWLVEEIRQRTFRLRYSALSVKSLDDKLRDHEDIIAAVEERNAKKAGKLMEEHIFKSLKILLLSHE